ncbi:MAG: hypothetical protein JSV24_01540, partial [Bacteroidales bacterium]
MVIIDGAVDPLFPDLHVNPGILPGYSTDERSGFGPVLVFLHRDSFATVCALGKKTFHSPLVQLKFLGGLLLYDLSGSNDPVIQFNLIDIDSRRQV